MFRPRVTYANVASTLALVLGASGVAWAATLPANSVGTTQLRASAVSTPKLATNAVSTPKLAAKSVTAPKLANGAVTTNAIARNAVTRTRLASDSVTTIKLFDGAVATAKLADAAVDAAKLAPAAVEPQHLSQAAINAYVPLAISQRNATIQNIGTSQATVATVPIPVPGRWLMTVELRAFPCTSSACAAAGHNLNCSVSGLGGDSVSITNVFLPTSSGTTQIVFSGIVTTGPGSVATLSCRQILGSGLVTLSYRVTAIKVVDPT